MGAVDGLEESGVVPDVVALEPAQSPLLTTGTGGPHRVEGIGVGFEPPFLDRDRCSEIRTIDEEQAMVMARRLAAEEGLLCGVSTGLNVSAAIELAEERGPGSNVVTFGCDSGAKYLTGDLFA
jgi:cysteine synthase A